MSRKLHVLLIVMSLFSSVIVADNEKGYMHVLAQRSNQQLPTNSVTLSPNPTTDKRFTITLNNLEGESQVAIYNVIGVLIKKIKMTSKKTIVDLNDFSTGIYLVNVSNKRRNLVKKIVVK